VSVYVVIEIEVIDERAYGEYLTEVPGTLERHGGRYLARGGAVTPLAGGWAPERVVLLEFPSADAVRTWLSSEEYGRIAPLRERSTRGRAILVEGLPDSA